ncbi:MAG: type IV pilus modification protein PilV [Methylobacter sp.]
MTELKSTPVFLRKLMKNNTGFTLIEVLIAMIILAVGLLGLAGLQATSLRNNQSAYNRSQATQLAYDIADRMRANVPAANNYAGTFMAPSAAAAQADCITISLTCTAAHMAQNDLFQWNSAVTTALPGGAGTIARAGSVFTITITWDDNRDGSVNASDPNFQTSFQL